MNLFIKLASAEKVYDIGTSLYAIKELHYEAQPADFEYSPVAEDLV